MAEIAGGHHERLDGKGYPKGLAAERPYRAALPVPEALAIMAEDMGKTIDPTCFEALRRAFDRLDAAQAA